MRTTALPSRRANRHTRIGQRGGAVACCHVRSCPPLTGALLRRRLRFVASYGAPPAAPRRERRRRCRRRRRWRDAAGDRRQSTARRAGDVAPPGWRLVWSDEFDGAAGSAVDATKWKFDLGNNNGWGNAELEDYTNRTQNAALDGNGNLVITARKEALGGQSYTSARLLTQGKATWTYGRFEARIQIPKGQGIWPAFWMLGDNIGTAGWPTCGEVDIMENIGREPTLIHGTMHGPGYSGGNGIGGPASLPGNAAYAAAFHVFAVEWEMNIIRWYVDGTQYFATTPASIPDGHDLGLRPPVLHHPERRRRRRLARQPRRHDDRSRRRWSSTTCASTSADAPARATDVRS